MILTKLPDFGSTGNHHRKEFLSKSTNCNPFPKIEDVAMAYFRPRRAAELVYKNGWGSVQQQK